MSNSNSTKGKFVNFYSNYLKHKIMNIKSIYDTEYIVMFVNNIVSTCICILMIGSLRNPRRAFSPITVSQFVLLFIEISHVPILSIDRAMIKQMINRGAGKQKVTSTTRRTFFSPQRGDHSLDNELFSDDTIFEPVLHAFAGIELNHLVFSSQLFVIRCEL